MKKRSESKNNSILSRGRECRKGITGWNIRHASRGTFCLPAAVNMLPSALFVWPEFPFFHRNRFSSLSDNCMEGTNVFLRVFGAERRAKIFMLIGDCSANVWKESVYSEAEERTVRIANSQK